MKRSFILGALLTVVSVPAATAQVGPHVAFDATYKLSQGGTMHMMSDGNGHIRTEMGAQAHNAINIVDYQNRTITVLMPERKTGMQMPMGAEHETVADEQSARSHNATPLGAKVVDGHPCHGWQYSSPRGTTQVWIGDDIHFMVHTETTTPNHVSTLDLKEFSSAAPPAAAFAIPADYKIMSMGAGLPSMESLRALGANVGSAGQAGMQQNPRAMQMMQGVSRMMQMHGAPQGMPNMPQGFMPQSVPASSNGYQSSP